MHLLRHPALSFWIFASVVCVVLVTAALVVGSDEPLPATVSSPAASTQLIGEWRGAAGDLNRMSGDAGTAAVAYEVWAGQAVKIAEDGLVDATIRTGAGSALADTWVQARDLADALVEDPSLASGSAPEALAIGDDLTRANANLTAFGN